MGIKKYIGDRQFYKTLIIIALPIILQNGITNFVSLLDNIMVGQVGTEQMSGVAIVNQLIFVFNLCVFGGVSGAGIFTAQFFGSGDTHGVRQTFRFKLYICAAAAVLFISAFLIWGDKLISLYLHETENSGDLASTLYHGRRYLNVMLIGLAPYALCNAYASTLRESGHTVLPMAAGIAAVCVNLVFNWLLIFGNLGFPALGVEGAAIATVLSRYVEFAIVAIWTHTHAHVVPFIRGTYKSLRIEGTLVKHISVKGTPLLMNELLWSIGMTAIIQCYSMRGLTAVAAVNISSTLSNLFNTVLLAMGNSVAIIVGNLLGANEMEKARDTDRKLIAASVVVCAFIGVAVFLTAPLFPKIYNTTGEVKALAAVLLRISACVMPVQALNHCCYFTLRSGGKTVITFIFDSAFVCCICLPPAFILAHFTGVNVIAIYAMVQALEFVKSIVGVTLVKKGIWLNNIVQAAAA